MSTNSSAEAKSAYITIAANLSSKIRCCTTDTTISGNLNNGEQQNDPPNDIKESESDDISIDLEEIQNSEK